MSRLDHLAVRSPCSVDWAAMDGTDTRRFCLQCNKAVHNLSAMAPCEAEALLAAPGPAPCVRFLRRADGSVIFGLARAAALAGVATLAACPPVHHTELMGDIAYDPEELVTEPPAPSADPGAAPTDGATPAATPAAPASPATPATPTATPAAPPDPATPTAIEPTMGELYVQ
jgi:hypothetical protein